MPKISALPAVSSALTTDYFPVVQGGVTSQETIQQVFSLLQPNITNMTYCLGTDSSPDGALYDVTLTANPIFVPSADNGVNQTVIIFVPNIDCAFNAELKVNGGASYPILTPLGNNVFQGDMIGGLPAMVVLTTYGGVPVWALLNPTNQYLYPDIQSVQGLSYNLSLTPAGVLNAYQANINNQFFSLQSGMPINFAIHTGFSNTIPNPTLAVNGTAAKTIYGKKGVALANGDVSDTRLNCVYYDSILDGFILTSV